MGEKITLRLKSDPAVILPEGQLVHLGKTFWHVNFAGEEVRPNVFEKDFWEPAPPPYELPTGIGAVIRIGATGPIFTYLPAIEKGDHLPWYRALAGATDQWWFSSAELLDSWDQGDFRTLYEGVEL